MSKFLNVQALLWLALMLALAGSLRHLAAIFASIDGNALFGWLHITEEAVEAAIQGELASVRAGKQRLVESISLGILTNEEASAKVAELREQEQRLTVELASIAKKAAILAEWQTAIETLKRQDISGALTQLAKQRPIAFKQLLGLVFKPNSLKVRTFRAGRGTWGAAFDGYEFTDAIKTTLFSLQKP